MKINITVPRLLLLLAAIYQMITPLFASFDEQTEFNNPEIVPATYTFGIWGVITVLALLYAIFQALPRRTNVSLHNQIAIPLFIVYLLFSCWLFAADRFWLLGTVVIFVLMFLLLIGVFKQILKNKSALTWPEKFILEAQVALYTGWTTVAIFANSVVCLKFYGVFDSFTSKGDIIQIAILIGALINSLYFIVRFNFNYFYIITILWAFTGVYFGIEEKNGSTILKIVTVCALAIILLLTLTGRRKLKAHF